MEAHVQPPEANATVTHTVPSHFRLASAAYLWSEMGAQRGESKPLPVLSYRPGLCLQSLWVLLDCTGKDDVSVEGDSYRHMATVPSEPLTLK